MKGSRLTKADMMKGNINFIGTSFFNNGVTAKIGNTEHIHEGNKITVSYDGAATGKAYYPDEQFWACDSVNVLYPNFTLTKLIALFIIPLIEAIGQKYVYED